MPAENNRPNETEENNGSADEPIPTASEDRVLDETVRLAREGRKELDNDPKERGTSTGL